MKNRLQQVRASDQSLGPSTLCIHAGTHSDMQTGSASSPIYTSTVFAFPNPANANIYPRYFNTPNQRVIEEKMAALEGGEAAIVFSSGMTAITTLLLAHLKPGDHAVFQADLYGGTCQFVQELTRFGVAISFARTAEEFAASLRPETKVIYVESPSNPLLRIVDLTAIGRLGRDLGLLAVADNTFATPINQNPLALGLGAVIHSATKYLNGHSDVNAGVVVSSATIIERTREYAINHDGMLSFELRDAEMVDEVLARFRLVMPALSLGGVESLICLPSRTSHRKLSREERLRTGISDGLIRVSVGVEDIADLVDDFTHALEVIGCR